MISGARYHLVATYLGGGQYSTDQTTLYSPSHLNLCWPGKTKVKYFQLAVFVHSNVGRLQIPKMHLSCGAAAGRPVDDAGGVDVLHAAQDLVDQELGRAGEVRPPQPGYGRQKASGS